MDDKTFIFSKIKGEFKDEYKVLHNLRSMAKPKNQVKDEFILLIENHSKIVFAAGVSCLLVPTLLMILSGHAEQKSLWMWFIIEVGVCVLGGAHFTRKFFGLRSEIRENLTAEYLMSTLLSSYELQSLDQVAQREFDKRMEVNAPKDNFEETESKDAQKIQK